MQRFPIQFPLTIFYDASCPMCANEMHGLRDLDRDGKLELIDCSAPDFDASSLGRPGLTREALMSRIHARDGDGRWLVGVEVFEVAYAAAGLNAAARVWGNRVLRPFWNALYPAVADNRQLLSRLGISALIRWLIPRPDAGHPRYTGQACKAHRSSGAGNPRLR